MFFSRRFLPYFITQCLGALNDNVYKNVLLLMVTYASLNNLPMPVNLFVNLAAGVFILPFLLFSVHAGVIADHCDKAQLIKRLKWLELVIMCCAAAAMLSQSYLLMLLLLFLMGTQSAYFGPVKYALLPQALAPAELVTANAWVELGTFLSILAGTIAAGVLMSLSNGIELSAMLVVVLAAFGVCSSQFMQPLPPSKQQYQASEVGWLQRIRQQPTILIAILAISWFWFVGAVYLTQFANFTRLYLGAEPSVVSLLLGLFSVGIAVGSFTAVKLSSAKVELGILPIGLSGLALFGIDFMYGLPTVTQQLEAISFSQFINQANYYRTLVDLFMIGVSAGIYIVPLYSFIQQQALAHERSQVIAANNIFNALFMVCAAIISILWLQVMGLSIVSLFALIAVTNLIVLILLWGKADFIKQAIYQYFKIKSSS
ncbi:MFS transporter [Shewanella marina]|uniref:MFS transporter n=1 Tax=Shewanella marina TaxID=487319 RepID=UPI000A007A14|nr:MFS transporter [Shewanella marina]